MNCSLTTVKMKGEVYSYEMEGCVVSPDLIVRPGGLKGLV